MSLPRLLEDYATWLPLVIFTARIVDVSCGTFRTICVVRGQRLLAAVVGFFEVLVWLGAISSVVSHLDRPLNVIAYASGFATGNWVGMWLEAKLALGQQIVRLISREENRMAARLREIGYVVTELSGQGRDAPVSICFVAVFRRDVRRLLATAKEIDKAVFSTVEDVRELNLRPHHYLGERGDPLSVIKKK